jgi:hypothetical protein
MEQHVFFAFSLIIEGATEKVLQFIMPLMSVCNKNFGFIEKSIFVHYEGFKQSKSINCHDFCQEKNSGDLFRAAPYSLMLELHKAVLFH